MSHLLPHWSTREGVSTWCGALLPLLWPCCELVHIFWIICCFCLMPTWSCFQYPSSYTVPVSWLVINAECCTLTIDSMHCGVRFLLCEVFNCTFSFLTMHVLVFELYPATPRHCPDRFCLLRLRCILASASMFLQQTLMHLSILRSLVPPFLLRRSKCQPTWWFARRDLIITSSTVVHSRRLATLFTSCGVILKLL